jgi:hypothetical protein
MAVGLLGSATIRGSACSQAALLRRSRLPCRRQYCTCRAAMALPGQDGATWILSTCGSCTRRVLQFWARGRWTDGLVGLGRAGLDDGGVCGLARRKGGAVRVAGGAGDWSYSRARKHWQIVLIGFVAAGLELAGKDQRCCKEHLGL